jgi:hypothetical protein
MGQEASQQTRPELTQEQLDANVDAARRRLDEAEEEVRRESGRIFFDRYEEAVEKRDEARQALTEARRAQGEPRARAAAALAAQEAARRAAAAAEQEARLDAIEARHTRVSFGYLEWHHHAWLELQEWAGAIATRVRCLKLNTGAGEFVQVSEVAQRAERAADFVARMARGAHLAFGNYADRFVDSLGYFVTDERRSEHLLRTLEAGQ